MKAFKKIIIVLGSVLVIGIIAVFVLLSVYKKELTAMLIENLKTNHALALKVEKINVSFFSDFPNASVKLNDISITSLLHSNKEEPVLTASSLALSLNLKMLLKKQFSVQRIAINGAKINLIKNADGTKNFEFKQQPKDSSATATKSNLSFEISKLTIANTQFNFVNHEKNQNINIHFIDNTLSLKNTAEGMETRLNGDVLIGGLLFKPEKGAFLSSAKVNLNIYATIFKTQKSLFVHQPSFITIDKQQYNVNTYLRLGEDKELVLKIDGKKLDSKKAIKLLTPTIQKTLAKINVEKPLDADVLVIVKLGIKQEPVLIINIEGFDNNITIGTSKVPYTHVAFKGSVISLDSTLQKGDMEDAKIMFKINKGNVHDVPFDGRVVIHDLKNPDIKIAANLYIDGSKIKLKPGKEFILKGNAIAKINYSGSIKKMHKDEFLSDHMKLKAGIIFNDFSYRDPKSHHTYTVKGKATLTNRELKFDNLLLKMTGGNVSLTGKVDEFAQYALGLNNGFKADLLATTNSFDLTPYTRKKGDAPKKVKTEAQKKQSKEKLENTIQKAEESSFEFNVVLKAKRFFIRKVEADNAQVILAYKKQALTIKSISMNTCGGLLTASGTIHNLNKVNIDIAVKKLNVNHLLTQFENFGQKAIESKNLKGLISVNANFKTELDEQMEIIPATMQGDVKLKLENGHLIDFEPMQNISNFIFRNRNFQDIEFTELNETFKINGYEMQIAELEIGSNVLNLFVTGRYHFKDESNINLVIPWSNLKRRGKDYIPKNSGQSAQDAKGLKLNYSGHPKKMKISLGHKPL